MFNGGDGLGIPTLVSILTCWYPGIISQKGSYS